MLKKIIILVCCEIAILAFGRLASVMFPTAPAIVWVITIVIALLAAMVVWLRDSTKDKGSAEILRMIKELKEIDERIANPPDPQDLKAYGEYVQSISAENLLTGGILRKKLTELKLAPPPSFFPEESMNKRWLFYLEYIRPYVREYGIKYAQKMTLKMKKATQEDSSPNRGFL